MNKNNKELIIFDGTSVLNYFYYGTLTKEYQEYKRGNLSKNEAFETLLKSVDGTYINAIQGFLKLLFELIDVQNPSHLIVVWGNYKEVGFRSSIHKDYKVSSEVDNPLKEQFDTIKNILSVIGVVQYSSHKYESLDLAGSIAKYFHKEIPVSIFTRNSNALQLVEFADVWIKTNNITELAKKFSIDLTYYPKNYLLYNKELVKNVTGLDYNQIVDYKALLGNTKAGIPGAKGIGIETITPLLKYFNSIDEMYKQLDSLTKEELVELWNKLKQQYSLRKNPINILLKYKKNVLISKELLKIKTDIFECLFNKDNKLELSTLNLNIDTELLVTELSKIDLTPFSSSSISESNPILSALIQTYNPHILSPSNINYVGKSIAEISNNTKNLNHIIYLPNVSNITSLRNNIKNNEEEKETLLENIPEDDCINKVNEAEVEKEASITVEENSLKENNLDKSINNILDTLPKDSILKSLLDTTDPIDITDSQEIINSQPDDLAVDIDISTDNCAKFKLLSSMSIETYICCNCEKEFTVVNLKPKYCPNCGFSQN